MKVGSVSDFKAKVESGAVDEVSHWFDHILCAPETPLLDLFNSPAEATAPEPPPETLEADLFRCPEEPSDPMTPVPRVSENPPPDALKNWCIPLDLFKRILALLRQVYPLVPRESWSIKVIPAPKDKQVFMSIGVDDQYEIRINFFQKASIAMLVDHRPGLGVHMRSLERMALRNDCWTDFEGWISLSKSTLNRLWEEAEGREPPKTG